MTIAAKRFGPRMNSALLECVVYCRFGAIGFWSPAGQHVAELRDAKVATASAASPSPLLRRIFEELGAASGGQGPVVFQLWA